MHATHRVRVFALLWFLLLAPAAAAVVPGEINYQGLLLDSGGQPITGPVELDFALFDVATGGSNVWTESHSAVAVLDGVYDVILGSTVPITPSLISGGALWLEVTVEGETLTPRQRLVAVPYALRADTAEDVENVGGVSNLFITELFQHFNADGGGPSNDDPSEGFVDTDSDGVANFIDPDNDDDGLTDIAEVAQGSDVNLVTPTLDTITPDLVDTVLTTRVVVSGTNFDPAMTATFGTETPTLLNLTPLGFEVDIGPSPISSGATVTLPNGQNVQGSFSIVSTVPSITSIDPDPVLATIPTSVLVTGENFGPGATTVTVDGVPETLGSFTETSFTMTIGPHVAGTVPVVLTKEDLQVANSTVTFTDPILATAFVTSNTWNGALGGVTGADAKCQAAASAASLPGTYMAWISDGTTNPLLRFSRIHRWQGTDSVMIADGWDDLVDGSLDSPIQHDEFGVAVGTADVASNVAANGAHKNGTSHCAAWTIGLGNAGRKGRTDAVTVDSQWTDNGVTACNLPFRLYCFEQ